MHGSALKSLEELLVSLFEVEELYFFLKSPELEIRVALRPGLALIELSAEGVSLVGQRGCWRELFARLMADRPSAYRRIAGLASEFGVEVRPPMPPRVDTILGLIGQPDSAGAMRR